MSKTKICFVLFCALIMTLPVNFASAATHSGKIFLQVEQNGEAWYIYPVNNHRYYLGRPADAFEIMRGLGLGISESNLAQIPIGLVETNDSDNDLDGLSNNLETAIGTNPNNPDSDGDDFSDKAEIESWFNPNGTNKLSINNGLINNLKGRILLQVEKNGEAWYLNPTDSKRYYLGRPADAFEIMRGLGIGISDNNLKNITSSYVKSNLEIAGHYKLKYPTSWNETISFSPNEETYNDLNIVNEVKLTANNDAGYLRIYVLEDSDNFTMSDFDICCKTSATKTTDQDLTHGIKPAKKQIFTYNTSVDFGSKTINKGANLNYDIMISTKKFIHLGMLVYNESDVPMFEDYFDQIISDLQLIY